MKSYKITLLPGDGIGPEITNVTQFELHVIVLKALSPFSVFILPFGSPK
jgi:3-isopropylmalate dehydrogenase